MTASERTPCILLVDDDPDITAGLGLTLERPGRRILVCSDIESAEIVLSHYPVTHLVCDVQFTGDFGFEGLHFLSRVHELSPSCRIVLMTGNATDPLRDAATRFGAAQLLAKPFETSDLEQALALSDIPTGETYPIIRFPPLEEILQGQELWMAFQPIVRVSRNGISFFGFEALLRARHPWMKGGPQMVFEYAQERGHLAELNTAALAWALKAAAVLPGDATLFFNVDPVAFDDRLPSALDAASQRASIPLSRVVLEITERSAFRDETAVGRVCRQLRELGVRFALDDHGSAYSHLSLINDIRPSFIKISHSFGTAFELDPTKERIIRHVVFLSYDFGCETILEGIESSSTASALGDVGIELAQGFHFGRPCAAALWTDAQDLRNRIPLAANEH